MATLRHKQVFDEAHPERLNDWIKDCERRFPHVEYKAFEQLGHALLNWQKAHKLPLSALNHGVNMVEILAELNLDTTTLLAAYSYLTLRQLDFGDEKILAHVPSDVIPLVKGVKEMDAIHLLRDEYDTPEAHAHQMNNIRQMLLAMVEDVRVVLIKLAEQLCLLEDAGELPEEDQKTLASFAREIYAPLANRLGLGAIKWQLEDWAFRYLEPANYKHIAKSLAEKRLDRQKWLENVINQLNAALAEDGLSGDVQGRVKHIYSIWRKMQRKNLPYEEIYDVRAVRILVDKVGDCYGALGTVHRLWRHIPKEFDDYIAQPKPNGYRSLHTAVIGPEGRPLEVQIRTQQMHDESELGVCAHWAYKEGGKSDPKLASKVNWLRSLLEWQEEVSVADDLLEERVYVFTPKGDVVDLPKGSTPLDFAYHVHTQVGHRTRGAKVNGRIVPLTYVLNTGEQIEVLTQKDPKPGRDWLNPDSGYIYTARARAKARAWFHALNRDENIDAGKALYHKELDKLGLPPIDLEALAPQFNFHDVDDIYASLGRGDLRVAQLINKAQIDTGRSEKSEAQAIETFLAHQKPSTDKHAGDDLTIEGVGNLLTTMANCCHPVRGDSIMGYITQGRGVTIHRSDCSNLLNEMEDAPERVLSVSWGSGAQSTYTVQVRIESHDRKNLLRDITSVFAAEQVNVTDIESHSLKDENRVMTKVTLEISDISKLGKLLDKINQLPNVMKAVRVRE